MIAVNLARHAISAGAFNTTSSIVDRQLLKPSSVNCWK